MMNQLNINYNIKMGRHISHHFLPKNIKEEKQNKISMIIFTVMDFVLSVICSYFGSIR